MQFAKIARLCYSIKKEVIIILSQKDIAYSHIKNMIFHMELMPGDRISELSIASALSISRTPIHDALRALESEGLITINANKGASVAVYSDNKISEMGTLRLMQDVMSAELASYYASKADFRMLEEKAIECERVAEAGDIYGRIEKDVEFHLTISSLSGNSLLYDQQYKLYQQAWLVQVSKYTTIDASLKQLSHHLPLVKAIRDQDIPGIRRISCEHIKDFFLLNPFVIEQFVLNKNTSFYK